MDDDLVASHVDQIYGVPREDFTAERDRRVKELRAAGHRDEAGALRERRKPTVPAWAVDQLARRDPDAIDELISAADRLREAQRRAASGRGSDGLREASRRLRELTATLCGQANEIIESAGGRGASHLDDVERTLFTAAVDPDHHDALRRGWFAAPLDGVGFAGMGGLTVVPDADVADDGSVDDAEVADDDRPAGERSMRERDSEERRLAEERRRVEERRRAARLQELEQRRSQLQRSRERQQRRVDRAVVQAEELRSRAAAAQEDADDQAAELARIDQDLGTLETELSRLEP